MLSDGSHLMCQFTLNATDYSNCYSLRYKTFMQQIWENSAKRFTLINIFDMEHVGRIGSQKSKYKWLTIDFKSFKTSKYFTGLQLVLKGLKRANITALQLFSKGSKRANMSKVYNSMHSQMYLLLYDAKFLAIWCRSSAPNLFSLNSLFTLNSCSH